MKTVTCRALGGTCDAEIPADTYEHMLKEGMDHLEKVHPEMAAQVKKAPKDDPMMVEWEKNARALQAAAQDK